MAHEITALLLWSHLLFFVLAMFFVFLTTGYLYAENTAQYKYTDVFLCVCFLKNEFFSY